MSLRGPVNYVEVTVQHAKPAGDADFAPSINYNSTSSYLPRWDYGQGTVDVGNAPAARSVASVSGSNSIQIGFCSFAAGAIDLRGIRATQNGLLAFLNAIDDVTPSSIRFDKQSRYCHSDVHASAGVAAQWASLASKGWTRTGAYNCGDIVFDVTTTVANDTFTVPFQAGTYECEIDWGDGQVSEGIESSTDSRLTHTYSVAGRYRITIRGSSCTRFAFSGGGDRLKVSEIVSMDLDALRVVSAQEMWYGCGVAECRITRLEANITNAADMFAECFAGTFPIEVIDLPNCINFSGTFFGCNNGEFPLTTIRLRKAGTLLAAFYQCRRGVFPITTLVAPDATNFASTFAGCTLFTTLTPGVFDEAVKAERYDNTWTNSGLSAAALDGFFESVATFNTATGTRVISYSPTVGDTHLDSSRSTDGMNAINTLIANGWVRTGSY